MRKFAVVLMVLAGLACLAAGARYLVTPEFMPYHAAVAGREWAQLDHGLRTIVLGMLRIVGAGFAGCGAALLAFAFAGARGDRWPGPAAVAVSCIVWLPTLYVTLWLRSANPQAQPPV